jgi:hypothetical protein
MPGQEMLQCLWGHKHLLRNGPQKGAQFSRDGHYRPISVFAAGAQVSIAIAQPPLRLPTDSLDRFGQLF